MRSAVISILVAGVTMSLDNVLAVAGAAHGYPGMLIFGLALSIALMVVAANFRRQPAGAPPLARLRGRRGGA
jgi:predicted tellurium resistance membrane protein TerC